MPALDELIGNTATHIADQNKHVPVKTLCGQALDKESTRYFAVPTNFEQATCKVCRGIYFDQDWRGEQREHDGDGDGDGDQNHQDKGQQEQTSVDQEPDSSEKAEEDASGVGPADNPPTRRLFATLETPVNRHIPKEDKGD